MKTIKIFPGLLVRAALAASCVLMLAPNAFAVGPQLPLQISSIPLFVANPVNPNVLVILDDSESMDGTMAGKLISPDDPTTRGNIGRSVIRNTITNYEYAFNWGLMSYETSGVAKLNTYPYFMGDSTTMILTNHCNPVPPAVVVDNNDPGISPDNGQNCLPNPTPFTGANFVTYAISSDDPDINDVLYTNASNPTIWATAAGGTNYNLFNTRIPTAPTSWTNANFSTPTFGGNPIGFTPTDSGFLPSNTTVPAVTRQFYYHRAVGYLGNINGQGELVEPIIFEGSPIQTHFNRLMADMGNSTTTLGTPELKNAAVSTPLAGTLQTAAKYFGGTLGGQSSPITLSCQKNFVMLITDGLPTARPNGSIYPFPVGQTAVNDTIAPIQCLSGLNTACDVKVTGLTGPAADGSFPIPTYVLGLGDTVANANAVGFMNSFATAGLTTNAYLATDPATFQDAIASIVQDIVQQIGAASAVSLNAGTFQTGADLYQAQFNTIGWYGQLFDLPLNPDGSTGAEIWDASATLNAMTPTGRTILTFKPSAAQGAQGIPFRWPAIPATPSATEMDPSQIADLNMNGGGVVDNYGAQRVSWLRGSRANECDPSGVCFGGASGPPFFRLRNTSFLLGDIIDSAPTYVASPAFFYPDSMEAAPYSAFVQTHLHRQPMIYVGANDGMLHGFNATTGIETLAYVPSAFYKTSSLNQLMLLNYSHHYYVDGSPITGDAFFGGAWHTVLVGGFGPGGRGVYALDITNPGSFSEGAAASTVLWEYDDTNDAAPDPATLDATTAYGLGLTYGNPIIVKMNNNRWVAVFGNGYNNTVADGAARNANGYAMLYIVDLQTGQLIRKINTQMARDANGSPNGLNTPAAIDVNGDNKADFIYAGDLLGNIWKFDVSSTDPAAWKVAFTSGGVPAPFVRNTRPGQPMTEHMEIGKPANGALTGYMVYFGTGSYFTIPDETSTATQSFYGIYDPNDGTTNYTIGPSPATAGLLQQSVVSTSTVGTRAFRVFSSSYPGQDNAFLATYKGWFIDLPSLGERQVTTPKLENGKVIFTTTVPDNTPCNAGGKSWTFDLDAYSGNELTFPVFDVNGDGAINNADIVPGGAFPGAVESNGVLSSPGIMRMGPSSAGGKAGLEMKYMSQSNGSSTGGTANTLNEILETSGASQSGRVSWQQLK